MREIANFDELSDLIQSGKSIILDFYASWCGPCKKIAPFFEKISHDFTNIVFVKINVDEAEKIAEYFNISAMPTFIGIKNKQVVKFSPGASEKLILDILNSL
jgi:thioredoxin